MSVIIAVYNDGINLIRCLNSLTLQTYTKTEIIIIDNNSTEDIKSIVQRYPKYIYLHEKKKGRAPARNKGLKFAKGEIIAITDADCLPTPTWIEQGVKTIQSVPNCGLVTGPIMKTFNGSSSLLAFDQHQYHQQKDYIKTKRFVATANVFIRKECVEEIGYFNNIKKAFEDRDFGNRIYYSGYALKYSPSIIVKHKAFAQESEVIEKANRVITGLINFSKKKKIKLNYRLNKYLTDAFTLNAAVNKQISNWNINKKDYDKIFRYSRITRKIWINRLIRYILFGI